MPKADLTAALLAGIMLLPGSLQARDYFEPFPFFMTSTDGISIICDGPFLRTSGCVPLGRVNHQEFYRAYNTVFPAGGTWKCTVFANSDCQAQRSNISFFVKDESINIDLSYSTAAGLSVNMPPRGARLSSGGVLGQNGEDDTSPARDVDTYSFQGKPGEKIEITLGRDGSAGSAGEIATLRVRGQGGGVIGRRSGPVPLALELTLPGPVEIAVLRAPGVGDAFRGFYALSVEAESGDIGDRLLRPGPNVEH